jgi:hypothetical protein
MCVCVCVCVCMCVCVCVCVRVCSKVPVEFAQEIVALESQRLFFSVPRSLALLQDLSRTCTITHNHTHTRSLSLSHTHTHIHSRTFHYARACANTHTHTHAHTQSSSSSTPSTAHKAACTHLFCSSIACCLSLAHQCKLARAFVCLPLRLLSLHAPIQEIRWDIACMCSRREHALPLLVYNRGQY